MCQHPPYPDENVESGKYIANSKIEDVMRNLDDVVIDPLQFLTESSSKKLDEGLIAQGGHHCCKKRNSKKAALRRRIRKPKKVANSLLCINLSGNATERITLEDDTKSGFSCQSTVVNVASNKTIAMA